VNDTRNLSSTTVGFPNTGLGLLGSSKSDEVAVRFQVQLLF
jgi:hypothetical protein